jgi:TonB family protein
METMDRLLEGRVRDLLSTADRQLAAQSYDAAIDTYRTALAELSNDSAAVRTDVEERLAAAVRARETSQRVTALLAEARYRQTAGRLSQAYATAAAAQSLDPANLAAAQLRAQLLAAQPELATLAAAPAAEPAPAPEPAPAELPEPPSVVEAKAAAPPAAEQSEPAPAQPESAAAPISTPIEPPSFWQFEDDVSFRERPRRGDFGAEPELLSILDPAPAPPQEPDNRPTVRAILTGLGLAATLLGIFTVKPHGSRFTPPVAVYSPARTAEERVYRAGDNITAPVLVSKAEPRYTEEALQAQLQGTVVLYAQIDPSGNAVNLHVLRRLGMGLDARAIEAASRWRFQPAMRDGTPVTFETTLEVNFRLP